MLGFHEDRGVVLVKNISGGDYTLEELGGIVLSDQEEFNLLDPAVDNTYDDYETALRLVTKLTTAKLYQDIQGGKLQVVTLTPGGGSVHE